MNIGSKIENLRKLSVKKQRLTKEVLIKIALFILLILLARVNLFGYEGVFTTFIISSSSLFGIDYIFLALISYLLGSATISFSSFIAALLIAALFFFFNTILQLISTKSAVRFLISSLLADGIIRVFIDFSNFGHVRISSLLVGISMGGLLFLFHYYYKNMNSKKHYSLAPMFVVLCQALFLLSLFGLPSISSPISLTFLAVNLMLLISGKYLGIYTTAISSIVMIAFISFLIPELTTQMIVVSIAIFISSLFKEIGKWQVAVIFLILIILYNFYSIGIVLTPMISEAIIAVMIFILLPSVFMKKMFRFVPSIENNYTNYLKEQQEVRLYLDSKVKNYYDLFHMMSTQLRTSEDRQRINHDLTQFYRDICASCPKNKRCYESDENQLVKIVMKSIEENLDGHDVEYIERNCLKPSKFLTAVNTRKDMYLAKHQCRQEYDGIKKIFYSSMDGICLSLKNMQQELGSDNYIGKCENHEKLKIILVKMNIDYSSIHYHVDCFGKCSIRIGIMQNIVAETLDFLKEKLEQEFQYSFELQSQQKMMLDSKYELLFVSKKKYNLLYGVAQINKDYACCGDTYINFENRNHHFYAISDGMGVGENARSQSAFAIELLLKIVKSGIDVKQAITTINSMLKLKNRYETFATLDLFVVDNNSGKGHFVKTGAPASFLYRGNELKKVDSNSLPMGIIDDIEAFDYSLLLEKEDIIVLWSDGISDSTKNYLSEYLKINYHLHPQVLAKELLEYSKNDGVSDDLTIIVVKIN